jgi:hypothetical protein
MVRDCLDTGEVKEVAVLISCKVFDGLLELGVSTIVEDDYTKSV